MTHVHLLRRLGFKESFAIVVGSMIGTGVFLKTAVMAQEAGSPFYVLLAWLVAGLLSFMGALAYAELGCLFPAAGGEYVFLRKAYGPLTGFLYGWTRFWIASPGSIAAYAIGSVMFLESFLPVANHRSRNGNRDHRLLHRPQLLLGSVRWSGANRDDGRQDSHDLRAGGIDIDARSRHELGSSRRRSASAGWKSWSGFGAAVIAALWAFDGWNNLSMAAGEVREPNRVIPRALASGLITVLFLYRGGQYRLFLRPAVCGSRECQLHASSRRIAGRDEGCLAKLRRRCGRDTFHRLRLFRVGRDERNDPDRCPRSLRDGPGRLDVVAARRSECAHAFTRREHGVQGVWACVLAVSGTFDQLTNCIVFSSWIFYALAAFSLFHFRRTLPTPAYRTPAFPWPPIIFIACALLLIVNTLWTMPKESLAGLGLIAAGIPVYFLFRNRRIAK